MKGWKVTWNWRHSMLCREKISQDTLLMKPSNWLISYNTLAGNRIFFQNTFFKVNCVHFKIFKYLFGKWRITLDDLILVGKKMKIKHPWRSRETLTACPCMMYRMHVELFFFFLFLIVLALYLKTSLRSILKNAIKQKRLKW